MDILSSLALGFTVSLSPENLLYCFVGVMLGLFVGVLPGLGSAATIALLLPITYALGTTSAIIMLAGIWYGSMYGGSITSILLSVPGESATVMTTIDGYQMARRGRAGAALGMSVLASFVAGIIGLVGLVLLAPALADFALSFGPPEYFALTLVGLTLVSYLGTQSALKAAAAAVIGLLLGVVGLDPVEATSRFTYGTLHLQSGLDLVPVVMGLFGLAEVFNMIERRLAPRPEIVLPKGLKVLPSRDDWRRAAWPTAQGTITGFVVGLLPGAGATVSSYVAYALAKRWSRHPERYGKGEIGGVAAPEAANNSATGSGFIPLLTLGIPANVVMALMLGAFLLHGVTPGPTLMLKHPEVFWGIITSMFVGNAILLLIMLPLIGPISRITLIPDRITAPVITLICIAGVYGVNNNPVDIAVMTLFGAVGYLMGKFGYPAAPLVLAFVLGPIMETSLRQSLIMSHADFSIFVSRPVSGTLIGLALIMAVQPLVRAVMRAALRRSSRAGTPARESSDGGS